MFNTYSVYHEAFDGSMETPVAIFGSELPANEVLDAIFGLTQNLDVSWRDLPHNPHVRLMCVMTGPQRSTSVGDRIVCDNGAQWRVLGAGFQQIRGEYDRRHGGPYDRGAADAYYGRPRDPHYFVGATYGSQPIPASDMSYEQLAEYNAGYDSTTDRKDWG